MPQIEIGEKPITNEDEYIACVRWLAQLEAIWRSPGYVVVPRDIWIGIKKLEEYTRQQIAQYERDHK